MQKQSGAVVQAQQFNNTVVSTELINFYSMTSSEVQNFVGIIDNQGIPLLTVRLNAMNEFRSGTSSGISKAKEVIQAANSRGIEVCVDLHTWYTTWDSYFRDSASGSSSYRSQYISYVRNVLSAFSGSNVYAFMVLNEPQARTASSSENQFILDIVSAAKGVTDRPVSVRFMAGYSPSTGHYSSQIDSACDFLCRNTYWDPRNPGATVYGTSQSKLLNAISTAHSQGKGLWITEFGKSKSNLEEQRGYVAAFVSWAKGAGVDEISCWVCQPEGGSGESYNLFNGYSPYPAFYELVNDGTLPSPTPTPQATSTPTPTPSTSTQQPTTFLKDGFESGAFGTWDSTSSDSGEAASVVSGSAYEGTYSARFTSNGDGGYEKSYASLTVSPVEDEIYVKGYFRIAQSGMQQADDRVKLVELRAGGRIVAAAGVWWDGDSLFWWLETRDGSAYVETFTVAANDVSDWFSVQLGWVCDGSDGGGRLWVDGVLVYAVSGADTDTYGGCSEVQVGLAEAYNCASSVVEADNVEVSTGYISGLPVTPSPSPTVTPSPSPTVTPSPSPTVTPPPTPSLTPTPILTPSPSPNLSPSPSPTPSGTISPSPSPTSNVSITPLPSPPESDVQDPVLVNDDFGPQSENQWNEIVASDGDAVNTSSTIEPQDDWCASFSTDGQSNGTECAFLSKNVNISRAIAKGEFFMNSSNYSDLLKEDGDTILLMQFTNGEESLAVVGVKRELGVNKWILEVGGFSKTVSQVFPNQWYAVELRYDAINGVAQMFVNGEKILEMSILNTDLTVTIKRFDLGIVSATNTNDKLVVYADSVSLTMTNEAFEKTVSGNFWVNMLPVVSLVSFAFLFVFFRKPIITASIRLRDKLPAFLVKPIIKAVNHAKVKLPVLLICLIRPVISVGIGLKNKLPAFMVKPISKALQHVKLAFPALFIHVVKPFLTFGAGLMNRVPVFLVEPIIAVGIDLRNKLPAFLVRPVIVAGNRLVDIIGGDQKSVLLVDDDRLILESLSRFLRENGCLVDVAETGDQAIQKMQLKEYDVAIFDVTLPDISGIYLLKYPVKYSPLFKIVITDVSTKECGSLAAENGADEYLVKPFAPSELLELVNSRF